MVILGQYELFFLFLERLSSSHEGPYRKCHRDVWGVAKRMELVFVTTIKMTNTQIINTDKDLHVPILPYKAFHLHPL